MRIAVLTNVKSGRNKRGFETIEAPFVTAGAQIVRFDGSRPLAALRDEIMAGGTQLLVLNSGDGLVQGFWTSLLEIPPDDWPIMALLPRGTTNMTSHDIGLNNCRPDNLQRLIALSQNGRLEPYLIDRSAVQVAPTVQGPQCGAFFGTAAIVEAIQICKQRYHRQGFRGDAAHVLTVIRMLFDLARGHGCISKRGGAKIVIEADDETMPDKRILLFVASTLDRLLFGCNPFWADGRHPIKAAWIDYPPSNLASVCLRLIAGTDLKQCPGRGYWSRCASQIQLATSETVVLDGEFYEPVHGIPLILSATPKAHFVRF